MKIKFYGTATCTDCAYSKKILDEHEIKYEYIGLEDNAEAVAEVVKMNGGFQSVPTIVFPNGQVLVEPSREELLSAVEANK